MPEPMRFEHEKLRRPRRLPGRARRGARARRPRARPAAVQRHFDAAARPAPRCVFESAGRRRARPGDRAPRRGRAFLERRRHQGVPRRLARARLEARLEHRRAGALREAGDRRQPRLLLRGRLRAVARLRLPDRIGDLLLRAARAAARPNPRLGRLGAAAEDGRDRPHQGHRHALEAHPGAPGLRVGHRHRMRRRRPARGGDRRAGRRAARRSRRSPSAPRRSCSTTPRTRRSRSPSSSKAIATAGCAARPTSRRRWSWWQRQPGLPRRVGARAATRAALLGLLAPAPTAGCGLQTSYYYFPDKARPQPAGGRGRRAARGHYRDGGRAGARLVVAAAARRAAGDRLFPRQRRQYRVPGGARVRRFAEAGVGVLMLNIAAMAATRGRRARRGCSPTPARRSTSSPPSIAGRRLVLYGKSSAPGIAIAMAGERAVGAVVLDACTGWTWTWHYGDSSVRLLLRDRFNSLSRIGAVAAPLLNATRSSPSSLDEGSSRRRTARSSSRPRAATTICASRARSTRRSTHSPPGGLTPPTSRRTEWHQSKRCLGAQPGTLRVRLPLRFMARYPKYTTTVIGAHSVPHWYEALDRLVAVGQLSRRHRRCPIPRQPGGGPRPGTGRHRCHHRRRDAPAHAQPALPAERDAEPLLAENPAFRATPGRNRSPRTTRTSSILPRPAGPHRRGDRLGWSTSSGRSRPTPASRSRSP